MQNIGLNWVPTDVGLYWKRSIKSINEMANTWFSHATRMPLTLKCSDPIDRIIPKQISHMTYMTHHLYTYLLLDGIVCVL